MRRKAKTVWSPPLADGEREARRQPTVGALKRITRSAMALAVASVALFTAAPAAAQTFFHAENRDWSGMCMGIAGGSKADDAYVLQNYCNSNTSQQWYPQYVNGNGEFMLKNRNSALCLGVHGARYAQGTYLVQHTCDINNWAEHFLAPPLAVGDRRVNIITAKHFEFCVGISGGSKSPRAHLAIGRCSHAADQRWVWW
jgi:Ricin-type beta-trefoil lectin domain-like